MEISNPVSSDFSRAFRSQPVPSRIFLHEACQEVLHQLSGELAAGLPSVLLLTGPPGIGKTITLRSFAASSGSRNGIDRVCLFSGIFEIQGNSQTRDPAALSRILDDQDRPRMLIIDDAAALTQDQKALVFRAVGSSRSRRTPLSVVMVGDNDLRNSLSGWQDVGHPRLVFRDIPFARLKIDDVEGYLRHRLVEADVLAPADQVPFDAEAVELLFDLAQGVPRFVDHFAERALYEASREGHSVVDGNLVRASFLDSLPVEIGWPAAQDPIRTRPPGSDPPAQSRAAGNPVVEPRAEREQLRANPGMEILPPPRPRKRGAVLVGSLALVAGLAGAAFVFRDSFPMRSALREPTPFMPQEAGLLPHAAEDIAQLLPVPIKSISPPGIGPPAGVGIDPDPAQLLEEGLKAGASQPADAAVAYERAALWGNGRAAYFMGQLFETGLGVPVDLPRAQAWYSVAMEVPGAEARLASLADLPVPDGRTTTAPLPFRHALFRSGRTVLHWRSMTGESPQRYIVEYVLAGDDSQPSQVQTTLSAMLVERPVIRWRVIGLDDRGRQSAPSAWSRSVPPPR